MANYVLVLALGLAAGSLSGIIGTGASIMLLPLLVFQFGPKQAVPIMAIAALMSNVGKLLAWWREVDWRAFAAYSITGIPAAALGARTLLVLPAHVVDLALGPFFLMMIPGRRWLNAMNFRIRLWQLALAGAVIGFLTGIVISTGPLSVPAFTSRTQAGPQRLFRSDAGCQSSSHFLSPTRLAQRWRTGETVDQIEPTPPRL
jgi:uncharacterized protein